jgi:hypothetical protein
MAVYAKAHVWAFTESNILAAFKKTEIVLYNPDVVTADMMAPSFETSTSSLLPLGVPSPVRDIIDMISHHNAQKRKQEMEVPGTPTGIATSLAVNTPIRRGLAAVATTSAAYLVSDSPILSTIEPPPVLATYISPQKHRDVDLLDAEPITEKEAALQEALHQSHAREALQKDVIIGMQAQTVLQSMYIGNVGGQLQGQEEKKAKKRKTGKINMDGRAKILTQDDMILGVKEWQDVQDEAVATAAARKKAKGLYGVAMGAYRVREVDRKERNQVLKDG